MTYFGDLDQNDPQQPGTCVAYIPTSNANA